VQRALGSYLPLTGGTLSGALVTPSLTATSGTTPFVAWTNTGAAVGSKRWDAVGWTDGNLYLRSLNDTGTDVGHFSFRHDLTMGLPLDPPSASNDQTVPTTAWVLAKGYAPLASPTFTGDPKAPTPLTADNDTSIATTAFVKAQGYNGISAVSIANTVPGVGNPQVIDVGLGIGSLWYAVGQVVYVESCFYGQVYAVNANQVGLINLGYAGTANAPVLAVGGTIPVGKKLIPSGLQGTSTGSVATPTYDSTSALMSDGTVASFGTNNPMPITQGTQVFTRNFTAVDATHPIEVDITLPMGNGGTALTGGAGLFIDGGATAVAQASAVFNATWSNSPIRVYWQGVLPAGQHTFSVRFGGNAAAAWLNGLNGLATGGGMMRSTMTIREIGVGAVGPQGPAGPSGGPVAAPVHLENTETAGHTDQMVAQTAPPTITQGYRIFQTTFTAVDATHKVKLKFVAYYGTDGGANVQTALFIDNQTNALRAISVTSGANAPQSTILEWEGVLAAGAHTFEIRAGCQASQGFYINGWNVQNYYRGAWQPATLDIWEQGQGIVGPQGAPGPAAGFLQTVDGRSAAWQPTKTGTYAYNTDVLPTQAAGALIYTTTIIPQSATSKLKVEALVNVMGGTNAVVVMALFRDGVCVGTGEGIPGNDNWPIQVVIDRLLPSNAAASTTFTLYIGTNSGVPVHINGTSANRILGGSLYSGMTITERTV
jgi:hypothetical protein